MFFSQDFSRSVDKAVVVVKRARTLVCVLFLVVGVGRNVQAVPPFEIPATGELYEINLNSEHPSSSPLEIYFVSPGSVSSAAALLVDGPPGVVGVMDSFPLPSESSSYHDALARGAVPEPATIKNVNGVEVRSTNYFTIPTSAQGKGLSVVYHLHKDACLLDRTTRYVSRVTLWVNQVAQSYFDRGFSLRVAMKEFRHSASRAASIKPASDGKYRGEPIVLMNSIQYGGEYVSVIKRSRGKIRMRRRLPVVKYVPYRGHMLSLARLGGVLRGGQATFELSSGGYIYGVCFDLVRKRQVRNRYPLR